MDFKNKRWVCFIAGIVIEFLSGIAYAWSVFQTPLINKYGWSISQVSMAYTIYFVVIMLISVFFGAQLKRKLSTRKEVLIGAFGYGGGILLMGFMQGNIIELYLYFGVLAAIGTALIYPVLIAYSLELFPDRVGFAGGLMTAGYGLGAVIESPMISILTDRTGDISQAFIIMGVFFFVGIVVLSFLLASPPEGFREMVMAGKQDVKEQEAPQKPKTYVYNVNKSQMLRLPIFYFIVTSMLIGLACGNMIITQGSPMLQLQFGMAVTATAIVVGQLAITNTIGRVAWGAFSDKIGKVNSLLLVHIIMVVLMLLLFMMNNQTIFIISLLGVTFCYGGYACLVAPVTAELFGGEHISENYSVTYCVFGLSSMIGPVIISLIRESTGAYTLGFAAAAALAVAGVITTFLTMGMAKKVKKEV